MKIKHYARKRRQFSFLMKQIKRLEKSNWIGFSESAKDRLVIKAKKLFSIIKSSLTPGKFKRAVATFGMIAGLLSANISNAQVTFEGPTQDTFGLAPLGNYSTQVLADLDDDGDLDLFSFAYTDVNGAESNNFFFTENVGSASAPDFGTAIKDPFNIAALTQDQYLNFPSIVDIDGDGDLDLMVGQYVETDTTEFFSLSYYENVGSASAADFAAPIINAFDIEPLTDGTYLTGVAHTDLDGDGDYDMMFARTFYNPITEGSEAGYAYYENVGDMQNPAFADPINSPFGLGLKPDTILVGASFVDLDRDGDADLASVAFSEYSTIIVHYENTGDSENPAFGNEQMNPFGLVPAENIFAIAFGDIDGDIDMDMITTPYDAPSIEYFENTSPASAVMDLNQNFDINISPNPAEDWVNVNIQSDGERLSKLRILNILGTELFRQDISDDQFRINTAELNTGQYFLEFSNEKGLLTRKLIIK